MKSIPFLIDAFYEWLNRLTAGFRKTIIGKMFLAITIFGPLTFTPTVYRVHFGSDIAALQDPTWIFMSFLTLANMLNLCEKGDWRIRLSSLVWFLTLTETAIVLWLRK